MTDLKTSDYLRFAANDVRDVRTELNQAIKQADGEVLRHLIEELDDVAADMEEVLSELAVNAEIEELTEVKVTTMDEAREYLETVGDDDE